MVDRLADLKKVRSTDDATDNFTPDVEVGVQDSSPGTPQKFMSDYFDSVGDIKPSLGRIKENIKNLQQKQGQALTAISSEQNSKSSQEIQSIIDITNNLIQEVKVKLKKMEENNKDFVKKNKNSAETRIRQSMQQTLSKKFVDLMTEYQTAQQEYKIKYKERVQRQYKIAKPDASQEEIAQAMDSGTNDVFAQQILNASHAAAKNALLDIQARHQEILKIEKSINELHQLFVDMAVLVESQGELIDQIEHNVLQSVNYTDKGVQELQTARKYQKKSKKENVLPYYHIPYYFRNYFSFSFTKY